MSGVIFLMIAIAFVLVAFLSHFKRRADSQADGQRGDLWLLCCRPGLSNAGGLVLLLAAGIGLYARPRAASYQPHLHTSVGEQCGLSPGLSDLAASLRHLARISTPRVLSMMSSAPRSKASFSYVGSAWLVRNTTGKFTPC
jgi:hypothetical protein